MNTKDRLERLESHAAAIAAGRLAQRIHHTDAERADRIVEVLATPDTAPDVHAAIMALIDVVRARRDALRGIEHDNR